MTALAAEGVAGLRPRARFLPVRLALRELRGGLRGFVVFVACIALGVMAIAGVGSFSASLGDGLAREGRTILGGDLAFSIIHREIGAEERAFLTQRGTLSQTATMRAMARTADGRSALVELKSADAQYPLFGTLELDPAAPLADVLAARDGVFGAAVEPALLARLGLPLGARVQVGQARLEIRATIRTEPDKLAGGVGFGPRLLVSNDALRASGLVQPGSLVRWHSKLRLAGNPSDRALQAVLEETEKAFPNAGWEVRTRANASPQLERNIERFTQFLTLVGLTALLVGGVGVANAVKSYVDKKRDVIATMKALGATGQGVVLLYLVQVLLLAAVGTVIGLAAGAAMPFAVAAAVGALVPLPLAPAIHPGALALAAAYGVTTALAFALWPLGRAHDVPVAALFRDAVAPEPRWPRRRYIAASAVAVAGLAALAVLFAFDRRIALIFLGASAAVLMALRLTATALMAAVARLPRARSTVVRLAVANIHRPGALTPTVVMSLGLGLALLVTVALIDGNLRRQFIAALPDEAPSFYFLDIQRDEAARFDAFIAQQAPGGARLDRVPMMRGRITAVKGVPTAELQPSPQAAWALQSDRGITYAASMPEGSRIVAGSWWAAGYAGPPLVSLERKIAEGLGLGVGDSITVNVLGRDIEARVANLRTVDWQSLGINFVLVYAPGVFDAAPHTAIATLTYRDRPTDASEIELLKAVADAFPGVTVVRVREALDAIGGLVANLLVAVRSASLVSLLAAVLVLGGALGASHRHRVYDAVVLKTLGATRRQLLTAYALEYLALGAATAVFGIVMGSLAAWFVVADVMNLRFVWLPGAAATAALAALGLTVGFGLTGTLTALGQKAAPVLRHR